MGCLWLPTLDDVRYMPVDSKEFGGLAGYLAYFGQTGVLGAENGFFSFSATAYAGLTLLWG